MLCLVDDRGKLDVLAKRIFETTNILGRHWVVAQWLLILHRTSFHYSNLQVQSLDKTHMEEV